MAILLKPMMLTLYQGLMTALIVHSYNHLHNYVPVILHHILHFKILKVDLILMDT